VQQSFVGSGWVKFIWSHPDLYQFTKGLETGTELKLQFKDVEASCPYAPTDTLFLNSVATKITEVTYNVEHNGDDNNSKAAIKAWFGYETTFVQTMDLHSFPFDRQILSVQLQTMTNDNDIVFAPVPNSFSWYGLMGGLASMWKCYPPVLAYSVSDEIPNAELQLRIERNPWYYLANVVVPLFLIVMLSMCAFALPVSDLSDRMSVVLTLVLTSVAFKYVVAGYLPKMSYMTFLDKYVLISFVMLCGVALENCVMFIKDQQNYDVTKADNIFLGVVYGLFALMHILLFLGVKCGAFVDTWARVEERRKVMQKIKEAAYAYAETGAKIKLL